MKRLTKTQLAARDELVTRLREAAGEIEPAIEIANAAIEKYNAILTEVDAFRDPIVDAMEAYVDDRSEAWHDSDAGTAYADWKGGFESLDTDAIETIEFPPPALPDELEQLSEAPDA